MNKKKFALMCASIALIASTVLFGTLAYLTAQESVINSFTVGDVKIKVDEAVVDTNGIKMGEDRTTAGNTYHLIPGKAYVKDPTLTILKDSEPAYVRMKVTITHATEWDAIYGTTSADLTSIFQGHDANVWVFKDQVKDETTSPSTITYEFRYASNNGVAAPENNQDTALAPLFTGFTVPAFLDGDDLTSIKDMEIRVVGEAIQKEGFASADEAWIAFDAQMNPPQSNP